MKKERQLALEQKKKDNLCLYEEVQKKSKMIIEKKQEIQVCREQCDLLKQREDRARARCSLAYTCASVGFCGVVLLFPILKAVGAWIFSR